MGCTVGHRIDYNRAGIPRGQQHMGRWDHKSNTFHFIDQKTPLPLIYQEIVPFQSEYKHSAIIWGIPLLNGSKGSVFLSELNLGAHVLLMFVWFPFRPFDFFKWFWQQIHHGCYVWSHFQHMPEYVFTTKKWNFSDAWPSWMGAG